MDLANYARASRREGKVVLEIPEARILEAATALLFDRAEVKEPNRLLEYLVNHLTSRRHTCSGHQESVLNQLVGETLAEAAHASAGIEWLDPAKHLLIHE
jgi:hypothetical protein